MLPLSPPSATPISVRQGKSGWLVYAIQKYLGSVPDGIFGQVTDRSVRDYQVSKNLVVDGIVGPATQRAIANELVTLQEFSKSIPPGLIRGLLENESGFMLAAISAEIRQ